MTQTTAPESSTTATAGQLPVQREPEKIHGTSRPGLILALLLVGQFMALLDVAVVNVAAPSIESELGSSGAALQLVVSGYTSGSASPGSS
jgi:hypothetical protein